MQQYITNAIYQNFKSTINRKLAIYRNCDISILWKMLPPLGQRLFSTCFSLYPRPGEQARVPLIPKHGRTAHLNANDFSLSSFLLKTMGLLSIMSEHKRGAVGRFSPQKTACLPQRKIRPHSSMFEGTLDRKEVMVAAFLEIAEYAFENTLNGTICL